MSKWGKWCGSSSWKNGCAATHPSRLRSLRDWKHSRMARLGFSSSLFGVLTFQTTQFFERRLSSSDEWNFAAQLSLTRRADEGALQVFLSFGLREGESMCPPRIQNSFAFVYLFAFYAMSHTIHARRRTHIKFSIRIKASRLCASACEGLILRSWCEMRSARSFQ